MPVYSAFPDIDIPSKDIATFLLEQADARLAKAASNGDKEQPLAIDATTGDYIYLAETKQMANAIAGALVDRGFSFQFDPASFQPENVAVVFSSADIRFIAINLGVLMAGGVYTAVDPHSEAEALAQRLMDVQAKAVFVSLDLVPRLMDAIQLAHLDIPSTNVFLIQGTQEPFTSISMLKHQKPCALPTLSAEQLANKVALITFSSGTTGKPKGIMLSHRSVVSMYAVFGSAVAYRDTLTKYHSMNKQHKVLSAFPLWHIYGFALLCYQSLYSGCCVVQLPEFELTNYLQAIEQYRVDRLVAAPSMLHTLLAKSARSGPNHLAIKSDPKRKFDISSVQTMSCGGAHTPPFKLEQYSKHLSIPILAAYGQSETLAMFTCVQMTKDAPSAACVLLSNSVAKVVDANGQETRGYGELCVYGPSLMKGYLCRGKGPMTKDGFFRTGDYAQLTADGHLFLRGRIDEIIHTHNGQVVPVDIENELAKHPAVEDAAVIGRGCKVNKASMTKKDTSGLSDSMPEPMVFEPSKEIMALSQKGGLPMVLQTVVATMFAWLIIILPATFILLFVYISWARIPLAIYATYCYLDPSISNGVGRRTEWVRRLGIWKYVNAYFPVRLVVEQRLDPSLSYVFGVSPHGILCFSGQVLIGSQESGLDESLEGITVHPIVLHHALQLPLFHEYGLALGSLSSSRESIRRCLAHGKGDSVAIVIGGAKESLHTNRGERKLVLQNRKGFVREAIIAGAPLVPTFIFGENDIYSQLEHPLLRKVQLWLQSKMMFALPLFYGRFGIVPRRTPLTVVFGSPIMVSKTASPTYDQINEIHARYLNELRRVYKRFQPKYDPEGDDELIISFVVYRIDTNGVEHPVEGHYATREEAEKVAEQYEQLGHKNGYYVRSAS
ncbi:2-acylglycerol O-acyltransferase 1 [Coemansia sp. RSA 1086]|nr:2-acylglycerol O-acyltransferase 1 [Coemansia sp. RSA 1086]